MTTAAWFQPGVSGIAGDMALGALIDAGAPPHDIEALCRRLPYPGWELRATTVMRAGLRGTHAHVAIDESAHQHHRRAAEIIDAIGTATLPPRVSERAIAVFAKLAEVEGHLHGVAPADVTFHELGAVDSIVDIVGVCAALEVLGVDVVESGPVALGHGSVASQHGRLPNPAPATAALLTGLPVVGIDVAMELTTPTGAALLATLSRRFGALSPMTIKAVGYGAGSRDLAGRANLVQVVVGEVAEASPLPHPPTSEEVVLLETTVDDVSGEVLAHTVNQLLGAGALDAWLAPVTMKKGRPGHVVVALCRPIDAEVVRAVLAAETGTLGIRTQQLSRWVAPRRHETVEVGGQSVRVKVSPHRSKAEFDDVAAAARALGRPLREVAQAAEAALAVAPDADADTDGAEDSLRHNDR